MSEFENKAKTKGRKRGNPNWRKGGPSPNPGGRPPTSQELKDDFRTLTEAAMARARKLLKSKDESIAKDITIAIMRKGLPDGLSIEISGPDQGPITHTSLRLDDLSDEELSLLHGLATRGGASGRRGD